MWHFLKREEETDATIQQQNVQRSTKGSVKAAAKQSATSVYCPDPGIAGSQSFVQTDSLDIVLGLHQLRREGLDEQWQSAGKLGRRLGHITGPQTGPIRLVNDGY